MGLMFFVLCWKLAKSPRSQGVRSWIHSSYKIHTKNVLNVFTFGTIACEKHKKTKLKTKMFDKRLYTCMLQSKKQRKLLTFFWFWLQQDLNFFSLFEDWFSSKFNRQFLYKKLSTPMAMQKHLNSPVFWKCSTNFSFIFVIWIETRLKFKH